MNPGLLIDTIKNTLAPDLDPATLHVIASREFILSKPATLEYLFRKYVDWERYLADYPDVAITDMDPVLHYFRYGILEGRNIVSKRVTPVEVKAAVTRPRVSVIMCNYNNQAYLSHALQSLVNQTLEGIEIIVVDDGSTDQSAALIKQAAHADPRIRAVFFETNRSTHMARKHGVMAASGEYIMFLDSDDFYESNACEIAYNAAYAGYDIVNFGVNIICQTRISEKQKIHEINWLNKGNGKQYHGTEILKCIFRDDLVSPILWNKIYKADVAKRAFSETSDARLYSGEDRYELLALAHNADSLLEIGHRLYNYRYGSGISNSGYAAHAAEGRLEAGNTVGPIREFCERWGIDEYADIITRNFMPRAVEFLLTDCKPEKFTTCFDLLVSQYGLLKLLQFIQHKYSTMWKFVADKFQYYVQEAVPKKIKHIGIYYPIIKYGGVEAVLYPLFDGLLDAGYKITLILRVSHDNNLHLDPRIHIVYIGDQGYWGINNSHLFQMYEYVTKNQIDVIFYQEGINKSFLWEAILFKYLGVPVIFFHHSTYVRQLHFPGDKYDLQNVLSIYRCLDKVICLSRQAELFMRLNGIDAQYIFNPIKQDHGYKANPHSKTIVMCGRLGDAIKRVEEALHIFREVLKVEPDARLILIGAFLNGYGEKEFQAVLSNYGLEGKVEVTGWTRNVYSHLAKSAVMLCTSWAEAFPMSIGEAQSTGMPVVMYKLPIMQAVDNESIIGIEEGDRKAAAEAIVKLLTDHTHWERLSKIALNNCKKYTVPNYMEAILECMKDLGSQSPITRYAIEDYRGVLDNLARHGMHMPPWLQMK
ncbi:MAG: glycosyltransferase [Clostridia bacterium]|nr:glycosyltransferase [Clostridia bacterium]